MTNTGRTLQLVLTSPPQPVRATMGDAFSVSVIVTARNISRYEVNLTFDPAVFEETSGQPNPRVLGGGNTKEEVGWWLQVHSASAGRSIVAVAARANELYQTAQFDVEVVA